MNDIKKSLDRFLEGQGKNKGRKADERYASFDFCYNHFYSFYKEKKLSELTNEKMGGGPPRLTRVLFCMLTMSKRGQKAAKLF